MVKADSWNLQTSVISVEDGSFFDVSLVLLIIPCFCQSCFSARIFVCLEFVNWHSYCWNSESSLPFFQMQGQIASSVKEIYFMTQ